jgi:CHAT domain-containing protein
MNEEANQEHELKEYLLCKLNEAEQKVLEERLMADDELFDLLDVVEDELFDDYIDHTLKDDERERFENFVLLTPDRQKKLSFARALKKYVTPQAAAKTPISDNALPIRRPPLGGRQPMLKQIFASPYLKLAVAAVIVLGLALGVRRVCFPQSEVDKGIAALARAYETERPIESRVSGLDYAPLSNTRGGEPAKVDEISLSRAERILLDEVAEHPGPKARHALGRFYLTQQKFDKAIEQLNTAATDDQQDAHLQSDLGAALLEKGRVDRSKPESGMSLEDFASSLERINKALSLNGSLLEALFNLGLCHQYMLLNQQAQKDWQKYLEHDKNSLWAEEARRNLRELEEHMGKSQSNEQVIQQLLDACQNQQEGSAWKLVTENTEAITGRLVWWQLVGAFSDLSVNGQNAKAEADRILDALAYVGELAQQRTGDGYVSALAGFYKSSSPKQWAGLLRAHQLVNSGHGFCLQSKVDKALNAYTEARQQYSQAGDRWEAAFADYWIGYCYLQQKKTETSRAVFEPLIEYSRRKNFLWLLAQAVSSFANSRQNTDELSKGIELTKQALQISSRIEDNYAFQKNLAQLANHYKFVSDYQQSFNQLNRALSAGRACWPGPRQMWRTYETLAEVLNGSEFYAAAADCEKEALSLALEEIHDPGLTYVCYVHLGVIYERLQNPPEALRLAQLGFDTVKHLADDPAGGSMIAYATMQLGHIYRRIGDYAAASACYSRAIDFIGELEKFNVVAYDARKGRLRCYVAQGLDELAKQELDNVLKLTDRFRSNILEERSRNKFFDAEQGIFDVAIDFEYSRMHNAREAFELSESSRARSLWDLINSQAAVSGKKAETDIVIPYVKQPLKLQEIMARLPERAQILEYGVLDDKVLIWVISSKDFAVAESKMSLKQLKEKALAYGNAIATNKEDRLEQSKELYDILIAPVESLLDSTRQICIVPDKSLNYLPFNTLVSPRSGRYLISDYTLSFSPSSNVFLQCTEDAAHKSQLTNGERLLSVGNPRIDSEKFPGLRELPSATKEASEIAIYYPSNRVLVEDDAKAETVGTEMAKSDVIHLASHYVVDERSPLLSKLLLTRGPGTSAPPRNSDDQDGVLQAAQIYQQSPLRARLVVLSACQTAIEGYYNGEGAFGMSRTFIAARIPLVVASLWPVDSDSTKELMISFHRYRKGTDPITTRALRQAQLDMISGSDRRFAEPKYWASFVVIGGYAEF